jgi:hypothetical protein
MCLSPTNRTLVLQTCGRQRTPYSLHHRERCRASEQAEHSQQRVLDKVFSVPDVAGEAPTVGVRRRRRTVFLQLVDVPAPGPADSALNAKCICGSIHHCAAPVRSTRRTGKPRRYLARYLGQARRYDRRMTNRWSSLCRTESSQDPKSEYILVGTRRECRPEMSPGRHGLHKSKICSGKHSRIAKWAAHFDFAIEVQRCQSGSV